MSEYINTTVLFEKPYRTMAMTDERSYVLRNWSLKNVVAKCWFIGILLMSSDILYKRTVRYEYTRERARKKNKRY